MQNVGVLFRFFYANARPPSLSCSCLVLVRGEWKKASQLIDEMRRKGLKPDRYSYTSAIHACGKARSPLEALRLLRAMETNNVGNGVSSPCLFDTKRSSGLVGVLVAGVWF